MTNQPVMTNQLPEHVSALAARTREFIRTTVIPEEPRPGDYLERDVRVRLQEAAKAAGVFAPHVSTEFGGQGLEIQWWPAVFQEAGYSPIGPAVLNCMAPDEGNMHMLGIVADQEQKQEFLAPLAAGEIRSSFAMTEPHPGTGSDPASLTTAAEPDGDGWVINGDKRFISGAIGAGFAIVMARTPALDAAAGTAGAEAGATMFLVRMDNPGVRIGAPIHTIDRAIEGGHPHVHFENCRVERSAVLGEVGKGFVYAQVRLGPARLTHCMRWLGLARRAQDIALDRAERREIFGSPMKDLGLAQDLLARNEIDLETTDAIITKTAHLLASDARAGAAMSSIAKVHSSDSVFAVIDRAIQVCGGDGVSDGLPLAQYLNEVRPFRIYDGSNETHKWAIARRASKRRRREVEAGAPYQADVPEGAGE